ncbi:unnamed protein product [Rhizoctonia solani]|uniref:Uncharacterized protein n=1 Tax=Rhizoctonia solani TaxID=456999 RepID=A0A8H3DCE4_9AGAM|nr:unnamed protein product [Rhizoctonia solani]CAE6522148.1 unnamed protein product [Rhizoctonia solani]
MLDNTYPQKDLKKARLSAGGPTKAANGNKRPADSTPDPNLKKRRKDADLMPAPSLPANAPPPKSDRPTDLSSLPTSSLISYLVKHDVLPPVHPSPYTSQPALAPTSLLDPASTETPILTDLDAVHNVLAKLAERHWVTKSVRETDTLAGFMWSAQRARERNLLAASSTGH